MQPEIIGTALSPSTPILGLQKICNFSSTQSILFPSLKSFRFLPPLLSPPPALPLFIPVPELFSESFNQLVTAALCSYFLDSILIPIYHILCESRCHKCKKKKVIFQICQFKIVLTMSPKCHSKVILNVKINSVTIKALIDTGSLQSFVNTGIAKAN